MENSNFKMHFNNLPEDLKSLILELKDDRKNGYYNDFNSKMVEFTRLLEINCTLFYSVINTIFYGDFVLFLKEFEELMNLIESSKSYEKTLFHDLDLNQIYLININYQLLKSNLE